MVVYEAPDGEVVCKTCLDDDELLRWEQNEHFATDSLPGESCIICGIEFN